MTAKRLTAAASLGFGTLLGVNTSFAEPVADVDSGATPTLSEEQTANRSAGNRLIEEIVVTSQKREERLLDVPIAVAAFSAEKLEAQGVTTADDLARITPGMTFTKVAGFSLVYLRGVGTDAFLPGADQSVPQYLDGVNILAGQGVQNTLGRVERVEVLKGPQGTLFGRNSTGGAINIITPAPEDTFFGEVQVEIGNYRTLNQKVFVNLPLADGLAVAISAFNQTQDEYYKNASGPIIDEVYNRGGQAKLRWDATDTFVLTLSAQIVDTQASGSLVTENTRPSPILGAAIVPDEPDRVLHQNVLGGSKVGSYILSGTVDWALGGVDAKLILSDQQVRFPFAQYDFDSSPLPLISFSVPKQFAEQRTAELQFLSNANTPFSEHFEWVAGLFYLEGAGGFEDLQLQVAETGLLTVLPGGTTLQSILNARLVGLGLPPLLSQHINAMAGGVIGSESASIYAQGTVHLAENVDFTLGARYQEEKRGVSRSRLGLVNPLTDQEIALLQFFPPDLKTSQFAPRVALQWHAAEDTQIYTSFSRGYQSPTYNAVNFFSSPDAVKAVKVDAYELGIKSRLSDIALQYEAAIFYTDEKNVTAASVSLSSGGVARFDNVGSAEIKGAEAGFAWSPLPVLDPGLAMTGGITYLDAVYTDYKNGRGFDDATGLSFGDGALLPLLPARDFTGNRITRTPKVTYSIGVNQNIPVSTGWVELAIDTYYNSGYYFLPQNTDLYKTGKHQLFNATASYFHGAWGLQLTAYCQNLTNETYTDSMFVVDFGRGEHLNAPRMYGLRAKLDF